MAGKLAFVFSGQGAQAPGMGRSFYEGSPAAKKVFDLADAVHPGTSALCFEGDKETLSQTINTQPCLTAAALAGAAALGERDIHASGIAGFSLGEIPGLCAAGYLDEGATIALAAARARFMQSAADAHPGGMAAVLKLENSAVEALCKDFDDVYPVNYNAPGQLVVAGKKESIDGFVLAVKAAGGRAISLAVSGAFHTPFMKEAGDALSAYLEPLSFAAPRLPLYANLDGLPYADRSPLSILPLQLQSPVRFESTIRHMMRDGFDAFIELGAGSTLCGLIRKIAPEAFTAAPQDVPSLDALEKELKEKGYA